MLVKVYINDGGDVRMIGFRMHDDGSVARVTSPIIEFGYKHYDGKVFTHYPPSVIRKVVCIDDKEG